MTLSKAILMTTIAISSVSALATDARERGFIREGMAEGEVLFRVGKPETRSPCSRALSSALNADAARARRGLAER